MTSRRSVLAAALATAIAPALPAPTPTPYLIRIVGRGARARLPDGGRVVLPVGTELDVEPPTYRPDALAFEVVPVESDLVFRTGFEP